MLTRLEVHDLAIVEALTFTPGEGLNVLTGETGAGKSVVARALALLLGERASPAVVRSGCDRARLLGEWRLDGRLLRIERTIPGRATLDGERVPLARLQELAPRLMARTGQHDQRLLLDESEHLGLLDRFARLDRGPMHRATSDWTEARQRLAELRMRLSRREERRDLLRYQLGRLDTLDPKPGEARTLDAELHVLRHAAELRAGLTELEAALYARDGSVVEALGRAESELRRLAALDLALEPQVLELGELLARVDDLARDLRGAAPDSDPERLQLGEGRLTALRDAEKRHRTEDLAGLRERMVEELASLDRLDEDSQEAEAAVERALLAAREEAARLHQARARAARRLDAELARVLSRLGMPKAVFRTRIEEAELGPLGSDEVAFELSANPGEAPRPLARVASGGELSRVLFALRLLLSPEVPSWLFDEVDSGIGGRVAESLASELRRLGSTAQVLCITHLPTVASAGDRHFAVAKAVLRGRTRATLRQLDHDGRIEELARMIGGPAEAARLCASQLLGAWPARGQRVA